MLKDITTNIFLILFLILKQKFCNFTITQVSAQTVTTIQNCQSNIYGCQQCEQTLNNSTTQFNCKKCENNLYLYRFQNFKYQNSSSQQYDNQNSYLANICVPSCYFADRNTIADEYQKQCIYLGPFCEYVGTTQSSVTGQPIPTCLYTPTQNNGYVLGQKFRIQNYLQSVQTINQTTMTVQSTTQLQNMAAMYNSPLQVTSVQDSLQETNQQVVSKCLNRQCKLCDDFDLTSCSTCWGRFGDPNNNQVCLLQSTCLTVGDLTFLNGCLQPSSDCTSCSICQFGFFLQQTSGQCQSCQGVDQNCLDCLQTGNSDGSQTFQCDICNNSFGWSIQNNVCQQCTGQNVNQCSFDNQGIEQILACSDGYVLNSNGTMCIQFCDLNQYQQSQANNVGIQNIQCYQCDSSCKTCSQSGNSSCISCNSGFYLLNSSGNSGSCQPKISQQNQTYKIYVLGSRNDPNFPNWQDTSLLQYDSYLANDFLSAMFQAYQICQNQTGINVQILLETGIHVINQNYSFSFIQQLNLNKQIDLLNLQFNLEIRPYQCSDNQFSQQQDSYRCQLDPVTNQRSVQQNSVQILNKIGSQFQIQVPLSLSFNGIIYDSIDSIQVDSSVGQDQDQQNCFWQSENISQPLCNNNTDTSINLNQVCEQRNLGYLFYFSNVNQNISSYDQIQKLNISNCTFQNIYYEMGSLVRLPQLSSQQFDLNYPTLPYNLTVLNTNFQNISNCGSIVSNDYPIFYDASLASSSSNYLTYFLNGIKSEIQQNFIQTYNQVINLNCSAGSYSSFGEHCYSITFINNTVSNLNHLKFFGTQAQQQYFNWKVRNQMEKFGLFITLKQYLGTISIQNTTFQNNSMYFTDICQFQNTSNTLYSQPPFDLSLNENFYGNVSLLQENDYLGLINSRNNTFQQHSLISIEDSHSDCQIQILNNKFIQNQMTSSIIALSVNSSNSQQINIQGNLFQSSGSYINSNILTLTIQTQANNQIQGYANISNNTFDTIYSGCLSQASILKIQRNDQIQIPNNQNLSQIQRLMLYSFWNQTGQGSVNLTNNIFQNLYFSNLSDWKFLNISEQNQTGSLISVNNFQNIEFNNNTFLNISTPDQFGNQLVLQSQNENFSQLQQTQQNLESYAGQYSLISIKNNFQTLDFSSSNVQQIQIQNAFSYFQILSFISLNHYGNPIYMSIKNNQFSSIQGAKKLLGNMNNMSSVVLINNSFQNILILQENASEALIELTAQNITIINQTFMEVQGSQIQNLLNDFDQMSIIFRIGSQYDNTFINISGFQGSLINNFGSFLKMQPFQEQSLPFSTGNLIMNNNNFSQISEKLINLQGFNQNTNLQIQVINSILQLSSNTQLHPNINQGPLNLQSQYSNLSIINSSILANDLQQWINNSNSQTLFNLQNQGGDIYFNNFTLDFQMNVTNQQLFQSLSNNFLSSISQSQQQHLIFNISGYNQTQILYFQNLTIQNWNDGNSRIFFIDPSSVNACLNISNSVFQNNYANTNGFIFSVGNGSYSGNIQLNINQTRIQNNFALGDLNSGSLIDINGASTSSFSVQILNSQINSNVGVGQTIIGAKGGLFSIIFQFDIVENNKALQGNVLGQFTDMYQLGSTLQITNCSFKNNQVINGTSLLFAQDLLLIQIQHTNFTDNFASFGTNGIQLSSFGNLSNNINILILDTINFFSTYQIPNNMLQINGSYIQIIQPKQNSQYLAFNPQITIRNSRFQAGYSSYGGVIYYGSQHFGQPQTQQSSQMSQVRSLQSKRQLQNVDNSQSQTYSNLSFFVSNSTFEQNQVNFSGGVFFFDELDFYNISIFNSTFQNNKGNFYGDIFYFQQSLQSQSNSNNNQRSININSSNFYTPISFNQIYLNGIQSVNIELSYFNSIQNSQALEGASIYSKNTFNITFASNIFMQQKALVRGGAMMLSQKNDSYFGTSFSQSLYIFTNNSFQSCQAQAGGSIFFDNIRNILFQKQNSFKSNRVLMYTNLTNNVYSYSQLDPAHFKNINRLDPLQNGKGPSILFSCVDSYTCNLTFTDGQTFEQNNIYSVFLDQFFNYQQQLLPQFRSKSIYFDNSLPNIPSSLQDQIVQIFGTTFNGTQIVFISNQTVISQMNSFINNISQNGQNFQYQQFNVSNYVNVFKSENYSQFMNSTIFQQFNPLQLDPLSTIQPSFFFGGYLAIVDNNFQLQIYDNQSKIFINCDQSILNPNYQVGLPIKSFCKQQNGQLQSQMQFQASYGLIQIPQIYIQSMPGQQIFINLSATIFNQQNQQQFQPNEILQVNITGCLPDQIINKTGQCQTCLGPSQHNPFNSDAQQQGKQIIQKCSDCFTTAFQCNNGLNITTKEGFQRLNQSSDILVQCVPINGLQTCLKDSQCREGYEGILCNKCKSNFYKYTSGSCQRCSDVFYFHDNVVLNIFELILMWASFLVLLLIVQNFIYQSQQENKLSTFLFFFKNIVNYIIISKILFEIFSKFWQVDDQSQHLTKINKMNSDFFKQFDRSLYMYPYYLTIIMVQCQYTGDQFNFNGIELHEKIGNITVLVMIIILILKVIYQFFRTNQIFQFFDKKNKKIDLEEQIKDEKIEINIQQQDEAQNRNSDLKNENFALRTESDFNENHFNQRIQSMNPNQNSLSNFREFNQFNFQIQKRAESAADLYYHSQNKQGFGFLQNHKVEKSKEKLVKNSIGNQKKEAGRDQISLKERPESHQKSQQETNNLTRQESEESGKLQFIYQQKLSSIDEKSQDELYIDEPSNEMVKIEDYRSKEIFSSNAKTNSKKKQMIQNMQDSHNRQISILDQTIQIQEQEINTFQVNENNLFQEQTEDESNVLRNSQNSFSQIKQELARQLNQNQNHLITEQLSQDKNFDKNYETLQKNEYEGGQDENAEEEKQENADEIIEGFLFDESQQKLNQIEEPMYKTFQDQFNMVKQEEINRNFTFFQASDDKNKQNSDMKKSNSEESGQDIIFNNNIFQNIKDSDKKKPQKISVTYQEELAQNIDQLKLQKIYLQHQSQQASQRYDFNKRNTLIKTTEDPVTKVLQINKTLYSSPYCDDIMNQLISATLKSKSKSGSIKSKNKSSKFNSNQQSEAKNLAWSNQKVNLNTAVYKEEFKVAQKIQSVDQFDYIKKFNLEQQLMKQEIKIQQEKEKQLLKNLQNKHQELKNMNRSRLENNSEKEQEKSDRYDNGLNKSENVSQKQIDIYKSNESKKLSPKILNKLEEIEYQQDQQEPIFLIQKELDPKNDYSDRQILSQAPPSQRLIIDDPEQDQDTYKIQEIKQVNKTQNPTNFCTPKVPETPKKIYLHQMSMQKSENQSSDIQLQSSVNQSQIAFLSNHSQIYGKSWKHQLPKEKAKRQMQKLQMRKQQSGLSQKLEFRNELNFNHDENSVIKGINKQITFNNNNYFLNDELNRVSTRQENLEIEADKIPQQKENQIVFESALVQNNFFEGQEEEIFKKHEFEKMTLFIMVMIFMLNTQIIESFTILFSCSVVQQVQFPSLVTQIQINQTQILQNYSNYKAFSPSQKYAYQQEGNINLVQHLGKNLNLLDSSYECGYDGLYNQQKFYVVIGHAIIWLMLAPIYILCMSPREYAIEIFNMLAKSLLILLSKYTINYQENFAYLGTGIILCSQFLFYFSLRNSQTQLPSEQTDNLVYFNFIDTSMWFCIISSYFIGIIQCTSNVQLGTVGSDILLLILLAVNFSYLTLYVFTASNRLYKTIRINPKFAILILVLTCQYSKLIEMLKQKETNQIENINENEDGQSGKKTGITIAFQKIEKEIEKEINQNEIEEELRKKEIRRIEILIHQLMMQQKQLQSGSASRLNDETSIYSIYNKGINASKNGSVSGDMYDQITQSNKKAVGKHLKVQNMHTDQLSSNENQYSNFEITQIQKEKFKYLNTNPVNINEKSLMPKKNLIKIQPIDSHDETSQKVAHSEISHKNSVYTNENQNAERFQQINQHQNNMSMQLKLKNVIRNNSNSKVRKPSNGYKQKKMARNREVKQIIKDYQVKLTQEQRNQITLDSNSKEYYQDINIGNKYAHISLNDQDIRKTVNFESIDFQNAFKEDTQNFDKQNYVSQKPQEYFQNQNIDSISQIQKQDSQIDEIHDKQYFQNQKEIQTILSHEKYGPYENQPQIMNSDQ